MIVRLVNGSMIPLTQISDIIWDRIEDTIVVKDYSGTHVYRCDRIDFIYVPKRADLKTLARKEIPFITEKRAFLRKNRTFAEVLKEYGFVYLVFYDLLKEAYPGLKRSSSSLYNSWRATRQADMNDEEWLYAEVICRELGIYWEGFVTRGLFSIKEK